MSGSKYKSRQKQCCCAGYAEMREKPVDPAVNDEAFMQPSHCSQLYISHSGDTVLNNPTNIIYILSSCICM